MEYNIIFIIIVYASRILHFRTGVTHLLPAAGVCWRRKKKKNGRHRSSLCTRQYNNNIRAPKISTFTVRLTLLYRRAAVTGGEGGGRIYKKCINIFLWEK